jgi:hypothetical protein
MAVPAATPVTSPETGSIVALTGQLQLHEPPVLVVLSVVVLPTHTFVLPVIAVGVGFIVTSRTEVHPVLVTLYVIPAVPAALPVTSPVVRFTLALTGSLLLQVPPPVLMFRSDVVPSHIAAAPVIEAGGVEVVCVRVLKQPGPAM